MLTERDTEVGTHAVLATAPTITDRELARRIAIAVIEAVDHSRNPVIVGADIVENLLKPGLKGKGDKDDK